MPQLVREGLGDARADAVASRTFKRSSTFSGPTRARKRRTPGLGHFAHVVIEKMEADQVDHLIRNLFAESQAVHYFHRHPRPHDLVAVERGIGAFAAL